MKLERYRGEGEEGRANIFHVGEPSEESFVDEITIAFVRNGVNLSLESVQYLRVP